LIFFENKCSIAPFYFFLLLLERKSFSSSERLS
jgi:hypothetical protein